MTDPTDDVDLLLEAIWRDLEEATRTRTPYTHGALATVDAAGAPRVRTLILRRCSPPHGTLLLATDARSAKVAEIAGEPRVEVLLHDESAGTQLRLGGVAAVVTDRAERTEAWHSLRPGSQDLYASPSAPGTPLGDGSTAPAADGATPFDRFAWVRVRVERIDHLDLGGSEHRRTQFRRTGSTWHGVRVTP